MNNYKHYIPIQTNLIIPKYLEEKILAKSIKSDLSINSKIIDLINKGLIYESMVEMITNNTPFVIEDNGDE